MTLLLTSEEAGKLRDFLDDLIHRPGGGHAHVADSDFVKEITVAIYGTDLSGFDERTKSLIECDS
ncbi:MAG: hypothetical protein DYH06_11510 [Acidobacteria bacterium ACB2]|nr:hypothetical protein [Acidobacteria bacterium ACB2]